MGCSCGGAPDLFKTAQQQKIRRGTTSYLVQLRRVNLEAAYDEAGALLEDPRPVGEELRHV